MDTEQRERPKGERPLRFRSRRHPRSRSFRGKPGWQKGVKNRSGSSSCTPPERDGGNSSIQQEPRRLGKPAPKALESGRIHRSKQSTERLPRTPPQVEATIPTRRKTSQHCESKAPKPRPGEPRKEKRTVSQFNAFRRVKTVTTGGTENGLKKEEARQG